MIDGLFFIFACNHRKNLLGFDGPYKENTVKHLTAWQQNVAWKLLELGAIKFGTFKLKLHETHPDAPLSPIYLNLRTPDNPKSGPLTPAIVREIALDLLHVINDDGINTPACVCGVPRAGEPFADVLAEAMELPKDRNIRLGKKESATDRHIDGILSGSYRPGDHVLLVDDLITKAGSKIEAINVLREHGLVVRDVVVLIDREQGGQKELEAAGCQLHAAFTLTKLLDFYMFAEAIRPNIRDAVVAYLRDNP